ncbi:MAG: methanogenesis marker 17 protein [Methanimicrococcus sp.]|nr:methanogenesis marker 17 protein [Methanimicrococcus sp.]
MEPLEIFTVFTKEAEEAQNYHENIADVISDLRLGTAIGRLHVTIVPSVALFTIAAIVRDTETPVRISDMSAVDTAYEDGEDFLRITIEREKYMPELTKFLWQEYTPANVIQADRWTILVRVSTPEKMIEKIKNSIIANPFQSMHANLIEMAVRTVPEGFRVRQHTFENNEFLFVASEDILKPEWLEEGKRQMDRLRNAVVEIVVKERDTREKQDESNRRNIMRGKPEDY